MRCTTILACLLLTTGVCSAKRKPKPTTQPDIISGCVVLRDIHSSRFGFTTFAGVQGDLTNSCPIIRHIFVTAAYYDASGSQFDQGLREYTLGANSTEHIVLGSQDDYGMHRMNGAKFVEVNVSPY